jgi:hypothetical protein
MLERSLLLAGFLIVAPGCNGEDHKGTEVTNFPDRDAAADESANADAATETDPDTMDASASDAGPNDASTNDASPADASSSDSDAGDARTPTEEDPSFCTDAGHARVDLVLAIDTSPSLSSSVCSLFPAIADFEDSLGTDVNVVAVYSLSGVNNSLAIVSAALCGEADLLAQAMITSSPRYLHVDAMINSNDGFQALLSSFDSYKDHLRANARTHFFAVTDDDIEGMTAATFKQQMELKLGHAFAYHALAGGMSCPAAGQPGLASQHFDLADLTGGEKYRYCEAKFAEHLTDLGEVLEKPCL